MPTSKVLFYDNHSLELDNVIRDTCQLKVKAFKNKAKRPLQIVKQDKSKSKLVQNLPKDINSKSGKLWLYQIVKDEAVKNHDESLLSPIKDLVSKVRKTGVSVYAVNELPSTLIGVVSSLTGSFAVRCGTYFDVWIDIKEIRDTCEKLQIPFNDCLEIAFCHEVGHLGSFSESLEAEKDAWVNGFLLWKQHGKSSEQSFGKLFRMCIASYS